jgi:hypothetical protein
VSGLSLRGCARGASLARRSSEKDITKFESGLIGIVTNLGSVWKYVPKGVREERDWPLLPRASDQSWNHCVRRLRRNTTNGSRVFLCNNHATTMQQPCNNPCNNSMQQVTSLQKIRESYLLRRVRCNNITNTILLYRTLLSNHFSLTFCREVSCCMELLHGLLHGCCMVVAWLLHGKTRVPFVVFLLSLRTQWFQDWSEARVSG